MSALGLSLRDLAGEELLFEATSDAVFAVDLETTHIVAGNARLEELIGLPFEQMLGEDVAALSPTDDCATWTVPFSPQVFCQPGLHEAVSLGRADGFTVCVTMRVAHTLANGRTLAVCVVRDETERRMLERELITKHVALRTAHQELEGRLEDLRRATALLEERKREFGELSERMAEVSRRAMLAEVVAEVAHSMNNPLGALASSIRMLGRFSDAIGDPAARERHGRLLSRCHAACDRMTQVVEELRDVCRTGGTVGVAQTDDLGAEIRSALTLAAHRVEPGVHLLPTLEDGIRALVPPDDVHHVVLNVVDNALQAVGAAGTVRVECRQASSWAEVVVSDSGPGIDPAIRDSVFDPFYTTKPRGHGTGLGLSMVRRIVSRWGGTVEIVDDGPERGATFRIRFRKEP